jgi:hypothetical protein
MIQCCFDKCHVKVLNFKEKKRIFWDSQKWKDRISTLCTRVEDELKKITIIFTKLYKIRKLNCFKFVHRRLQFINENALVHLEQHYLWHKYHSNLKKFSRTPSKSFSTYTRKNDQFLLSLKVRIVQRDIWKEPNCWVMTLATPKRRTPERSWQMLSGISGLKILGFVYSRLQTQGRTGLKCYAIRELNSSDTQLY